MGALDTAKKYVTDGGPNSRTLADRLKGLLQAMKDADFGPSMIETIKNECEEAIRNKH